MILIEKYKNKISSQIENLKILLSIILLKSFLRQLFENLLLKDFFKI